ncbi:MAG: HlyC/CorC family transporter [Acidobacteria bacterium]|nr:HlyC/CorC family transporter [Acidobacteriota bacterium]
MDDPASNLFLLFAAEAAAESVSWLSIALKIVAVLVLVAANGFFVAAEFAFVGVRRSRIEALAAEGNKSAKRLLSLLDNLNAYLSASQLGITLASLALGALGEPVVEAILGGALNGLPESVRHLISYAIAFMIITTLHIVLGEQAPKLVGLQLAEKVAMGTALPMQIFYKIFKPLIHLLDWASAKTVNVFGLKADSEHASIYTEEEIRQLITLSHHVNQEEERLIHGVFEFSETTVREAMTPRTQIAAIPYAATLEEIARIFNENGYSRMPVYRESLDDVAGFVHSKDVLPFFFKPQEFVLEKVIQPPVYIVDTAKLEDVLRQMQHAKIHFAFVVDEHGGVEGIISLVDLLEEIVGDISDEHNDEVNEQIHEQPDGAFVLDGGLAIRDLNRRLELNLPVSEGYTTVAGFLMSEAGQVLTEGESVQFNGHLFKIEKVNKRRILQVKMEKTNSRE